MALDGFSVRNVGLGQDQTSAQMAINTERAVLQGQTHKGVETISNAGTNKAVTLEGEKEKKNNKNNKKRKRKNNNQVLLNEDAYKVETGLQTSRGIDFYTSFSDRLSVRLNPRTEAVELYDKDTNKTIESITATELMKLIEKLNISSGILVNRKI